jgi:hypothetical protein
LVAYIEGECRLRVFVNSLSRRIFGNKRDEVTEEWRKLHNEELNDLYCSPRTVRVIKLRRMEWAGHVALCGRKLVFTGNWCGKMSDGAKERDGIIMDIQEVGLGKIWTGLC